ncbi:MAG: hypothetical protein H6741_05165 [Alphaproteobacteria bacterium]|nr:hypothetical protein [Alphaproteobacteria bacterium]MCB9792096.1 hypothetical protein [Alphaproteobacteria bacterium]
MPQPVHLLGPQRPSPNLIEVLRHAELPGPIALITAGWRVDEPEIGPLEAHVQREVRHLTLYAWFEELMQAHRALAKEYRARQDRILIAKDLYRARLGPALAAVEAVQARAGEPATPPDLAEAACEAAVEAVRVLDRELMRTVTSIRAEFPDLERPWELTELAPYHARIRDALGECRALAIAGGHVGVLRNRMQLMGFGQWLPEYRAQGGTLIAWAGGAMVLTSRVVLFYDDPPYGSGAAELFSPGFGAVSGLSVFPHARRRLRIHDRARLGRLVRRLAPDRCVGLENGAWLEVGDQVIDHSRPLSSFELDAVPPEICEEAS